jgi:hypothetical protein
MIHGVLPLSAVRRSQARHFLSAPRQGGEIRIEVRRRRSPSLVIDSPTNTTVPPTIPVGTDRAAE